MFAGLPSLTHEQQQKAVERDPGTDGTRDEQRPGNRAGGRRAACQPFRRANRGAF